MFTNCTALTTLVLYDINCSLQIGDGSTWGHLLTVDSLVHTINELMPHSGTKVLTMGSVNLKKIASLYCKVVDSTNPKLPMELCESTDEGAMTLSQYAALKNWQFK